MMSLYVCICVKLLKLILKVHKLGRFVKILNPIGHQKTCKPPTMKAITIVCHTQQLRWQQFHNVDKYSLIAYSYTWDPTSKPTCYASFLSTN